MKRLSSGVELDWVSPVPDIGTRLARCAAGLGAGAGYQEEKDD